MRTKFYIVIASLSLLFSSCSEWLDVNNNPNTATNVDPHLLFGYSVASWAGNRTGGDCYIPLALAVQTISSGGNYGWGKGDVYDISPYSTGNTWKMYYASSGNNLQLAIKEAESASPKNNNVAAQCKIVLAQLIYECTTIYGDIPFSEAWRSDVSYPKFDSQKDVFEGVLTMLDNALAQFEDASPLRIPAKFDIYYGGDLAKWKRLANSIKLRVLLTMVDKDPSKAAAIGTLIQANNMMSSSADNWSFPFENTSGKENPKFKILKKYGNSQNIFFFANTIVFNMMNATNDPRIPVYFEKGPAATTFKAVDTEAEADDFTSRVNIKTLYAPDASEYMMTYQEVLLLQAECYVRGIGVTKDLAKAQQLYKEAVKQALLFYKISSTVATNYSENSIPNLTVVADPLKEIYTQLWIEYMDRPVEAFVMWRRSGTDATEFPKLTLPDGAPAGPLFRRYVYPNDEIVGNKNAPKDLPKYYEKQWFDL